MTKELPLVSIIVPVYNVEKYLRKCLDSLISQTLQNIEIICVNDASPDNSLAILKEYEAKDKRIVVIDLKENLCLGGARNRGIERAQAEYVTFVDSDDWVDSRMCEELYNAIIEKGGEIANANCYIYRSPNNIREFALYSVDIFDLPEKTKKRFFILKTSPAWGNLYVKKLFLDNQLYFPEHLYYEDASIIPTIMLLAEKVVKVDKPLYYYYCDDNLSITRKKNDYRFLEMRNAANIFLQNMKRFSFYEEYKNEIDYRYNNLYYLSIIQGCLTRFTPIDKKYIKKISNELKLEVPEYKSNPYYKSRRLSIMNLIVSITLFNVDVGVIFVRLCMGIHRLFKILVGVHWFII